ncbi:hypothetical protein HYS47_02495 [Candidatus Woesearchaeota archaeon]|nr:hypothetical protein [Candidatus Woesearchaeota archaeon]
MSFNVIQRSFKAVKEDILSFKRLVQEWLFHLQYRADVQDYKIAMLEQRIADLEEAKEAEKVSAFASDTIQKL